MLCVVDDDQVAEVVRGEDAHASNLPVAVIKAIRHKLRIVLAAPDIATVRNWKSLGFQGSGEEAEILIYEDWVMRVEIQSVGGDDEMRIRGLQVRTGAVA
jgi:hypothetical protein